MLQSKSNFYIYIVTLLFSRRFYPKQLTNEDNRSNENQQKSNNESAMTSLG